MQNLKLAVSVNECYHMKAWHWSPWSSEEHSDEASVLVLKLLKQHNKCEEIVADSPCEKVEHCEAAIDKVIELFSP